MSCEKASTPFQRATYTSCLLSNPTCWTLYDAASLDDVSASLLRPVVVRTSLKDSPLCSLRTQHLHFVAPNLPLHPNLRKAAGIASNIRTLLFLRLAH